MEVVSMLWAAGAAFRRINPWRNQGRYYSSICEKNSQFNAQLTTVLYKKVHDCRRSNVWRIYVENPLEEWLNGCEANRQHSNFCEQKFADYDLWNSQKLV